MCISIYKYKGFKQIEDELKKRFNEEDIKRKALNKKPLTDDEKKPIIKSFMISEADRYFKTDSSGEPNAFEFLIESDGRIPPHVIFDKALFEFDKKLNNFIKKINEEASCAIKSSDCIMKALILLLKMKTLH